MKAGEVIYIIIPAYEPGWELESLCASLYKEGIQNVLIVDDGSGETYRDILETIQENFQYQIFSHAANLGKGRALKDAFNWVLSNYPDCAGVVTADSDGQHTVEDIKNCMEALRYNPDKLVLGCRQFDGDQIPWKSRFGNSITKKAFSFVCGIKISDTQTGLRGIPAVFMKELLTVGGERFEFETNMLLEWGEGDIIEVPIKTVYDSKENHRTHFDPIRDSIKIYRTLLVYSWSSLLSTIIDFVVFAVVTGRGMNVWQSVAISRVCAAAVNFTVNKKAVFKAGGDTLKQLVKYLFLVILSGAVSAVFIDFVSEKTESNVVVLKAMAETVLFFFNYYIQRAYVFAKRGGKHELSDSKRQVTDWTAYYKEEKSWFSTFTQQFTLKEILHHIKENEPLDLIELGGGNSCFAKELCNRRIIKRYDIIDNNNLAVEQFRRQELASQSHTGYLFDLLNKEEKIDSALYDFVYSVGLIEHFIGEDIGTVIERHFECCKPGGIVLISFPTPTVKYRIIRKCMEVTGRWQFHDEVPLTYEAVRDIFTCNGDIQAHYVNRKLPLTQMIVVTKKNTL